eukprot:3830265-Pleurochrysis_carterae.AAC.1
MHEQRFTMTGGWKSRSKHLNLFRCLHAAALFASSICFFFMFSGTFLLSWPSCILAYFFAAFVRLSLAMTIAFVRVRSHGRKSMLQSTLAIAAALTAALSPLPLHQFLGLAVASLTKFLETDMVLGAPVRCIPSETVLKQN